MEVISGGVAKVGYERKPAIEYFPFEVVAFDLCEEGGSEE